VAARAIRQFYDGVTLDVDDFGPVVEPWLRHRERFNDELAGLTDEQWSATTRCTDWDAPGVVCHLVNVDAFWALTLGNARAGRPPTTYLRGFDPSNATNDLHGPLLELGRDELLQRLAGTTDALAEVVATFDNGDWSAVGESPFGHLPARFLLAHALWDSWLHERDVLVPLGLAPSPEPGELLTATWFGLFVGALQGGLLDDPAPVGPGPDAPVDAVLRFEELPADAVRVRVDEGVHVTRATAVTDVTTVSAVDLVEVGTGRQSAGVVAQLPADLAAQVGRAMQIL
jgi:hypothetical protein